jgi:hypothetical protein
MKDMRRGSQPGTERLTGVGKLVVTQHKPLMKTGPDGSPTPMTDKKKPEHFSSNGMDETTEGLPSMLE